MKNYYAILEVPVGSSPEEIRQAYRRLAQANLDNAEAFAELKEAHETLINPARRAEYDREVWGGFAPGRVDEAQRLAADPERTGRCPMGAEEHCPVLQMRVASTDNFCPECGYLLNALGNGSYDLSEEVEAAPSVRLEEVGGRVHALHPGSNLVGREAADVLLPDKTVSRQHARLEVVENGEITLEDLSSTNGTQVNDQPLVPHLPRLLTGGDRVRFGSVLTTLAVPEREEVSAAAGDELETPEPESLTESSTESLAASHSPAQARLMEMREAASDEEQPREFLLAPGVTTFGRRTENTIVLPGDPYVSGSHAQIIAEGGTFRLVDVGSTNGTLINGARLTLHEPVLLSFGDLIVIGGTALRFEPISAEKTGKEVTEEETIEEETIEEVPTASPSQNEPAPAVPAEG